MRNGSGGITNARFSSNLLKIAPSHLTLRKTRKLPAVVFLHRFFPHRYSFSTTIAPEKKDRAKKFRFYDYVFTSFNLFLTRNFLVTLLIERILRDFPCYLGLYSFLFFSGFPIDSLPYSLT